MIGPVGAGVGAGCGGIGVPESPSAAADQRVLVPLLGEGEGAALEAGVRVLPFGEAGADVAVSSEGLGTDGSGARTFCIQSNRVQHYRFDRHRSLWPSYAP